MTIQNAVIFGGVLGGALGLASEGSTFRTGIRGAISGAITGGVLAALAMRVGTIATGALLGGLYGFAAGALPCVFVMGYYLDDPHKTAADGMLFFGTCSLIPTTIGAVAGAVITLLARGVIQS